MTLLPCSPCCKGCIECSDAPKTAIITLSYPAGSGTTIAADTEDPPRWSEVTTQCRPDPEDVGVHSFLITNSGDEYETAPTVKLSGGGGQGAEVYCEVSSPVYAAEITAGGSGYTSAPTVSFPFTNVTSQLHRTAKAYALVTGGVTSITVTGRGQDYTQPPTVEVSDGYGDFFKGVAVLTQYIKEVEVTNEGNGYTSVPTVVVSGTGTGAFLVARRATSVSSIAVTSGGSGYTEPPSVSCLGATLQANIQNGAVTSVDVIEEGDGIISSFALTSANVVFSGGGGSGAAATATLRNKIVRVDVLPGYGGTDFDSPPAISFSGGGGSGAAAVATMGKHVQSVTIQEPGSGYRFNPTVTFTGDGTGAAATAQVTGSVSDLIFTDSGNYIQRSYSLNGVIEFMSSWPTVAFSGGGGSGAAATLSFSGRVTGMYVPLGLSGGNSGSGYTSPPTVSIVGGGGRNATAIASIRWQQENVFRFPLGKEECLQTREEYTATGLAYETNAEVPPDAGFIRPDGWGEVAFWAVEVQTAAAPRTFGVSGIRQSPEQFPDEMLAASVLKSWHTTQRRFTFDPHDRDLRYYIRRFYSRIQPQGKYRTSISAAHYQSKLASSTTILHFGFTANSVQPAVFQPTFVQQDDQKGEPYWRVATLTLESGGSNLAVPSDGIVLVESFDGNIVGNISGGSTFFVEVTATFEPPTVNGYRIFGFKNAPVVEFAFSQTADAGDYVLSGASLVSGGEEFVPSTRTGYIEITSLGTGYHEGTAVTGYSLPRLLATITDGTVTAVSIDRPGLVRGPATITSATIIEEEPEEGEEPEDTRPMVIGASNFKTTEVYSAPSSVTASAEGGSPAASFAVTLLSDTDQNGKSFWKVTEVEVVSGGSGYEEDPAIVFQAGSGDTESVAASATGRRPSRQQPTLTATADGGSNASLAVGYEEIGEGQWGVASVSVSEGGSGYTNGASVTFQLGEDDVEESAATATVATGLVEPSIAASVSSGSGAVLTVTMQPSFDAYEVASVSVDSPGSGYAGGEQVAFSGGDQGDGGAYAEISVDGAGAITGVTVFFGGYFYDDSGVIDSVIVTSGGSYYNQPTSIQSVEVHDGGKYFRRSITVTQEPLDPPECIGTITDDWEEIIARPTDYDTVYPNPITVGETFTEIGETAESVEYQRTRICGHPEISIRLE